MLRALAQVGCIHNIDMYTPLRVYMAKPTPKLYWRIKKESDTSPGVFYYTWVAAEVITAEERGDDGASGWNLVRNLEEYE